MKILDLVRRREQTEHEKQTAQNMKLWAEYRAIIERADDDNVSEQEAERLAALMQELGITPADAELHRIVLSEHEQLAKRAAPRAKFEQQAAAAQAKIEKLVKEAQRNRDETNKQQAIRQAARDQLRDIENAERNVASVASFFPELILNRPAAPPTNPNYRTPGDLPRNDRINREAQARGIDLKPKYEE